MNILEKANQDKPQATDPTLSSNNESNSRFQSEQFKVLAMMKDNSPEYIVDSFTEAGFDILDVISQTDTTTVKEN